MSNRYLYKAMRTNTREWVEGYYLKDDITRKSYIHVIGNSVNESDKVGEEGYLKFVVFEIDSSTLCRCVEKEYMNGETAYEGDVFESQLCGVQMVLRYGIHQGYCPVDKCNMDSVGFYAEAVGLPSMPIGDLSGYALKVGTVFDSGENLEN